MGFDRLLKKVRLGGGHIAVGHLVDAAIKSNKTGRPYGECLKKSVKETLTEDLPGTRDLYQAGREDGKREGTVEQSKLDARKMERMQEEHRSEAKKWEEQKERYETFLDEVEREKREEEKKERGE